MTTNMKKLITSYKGTKKQLKSMLAQVVSSDQGASSDHAHHSNQEALRSSLAASIRDVEYAIEWLETRRQPDNQRGIERRSKEQREILLDPFKMQSYVTPGTGGCRVGVSDAEREMIDFYLQFVTEKERECYLMVHGGGFTHDKVAEMLFLSRGNVSTLLSRAQQKIEFAKNLTAILVMAVFFLRKGALNPLIANVCLCGAEATYKCKDHLARHEPVSKEVHTRMILHPRLLGVVRVQLANKGKQSTNKPSTETQSTDKKAYQTRRQAKTFEGRPPPKIDKASSKQRKEVQS
ncbi:hypothetical protein C2W64_04668 [Brevibacillus laterosporus]|nr:sigma factor-like helix-turn-helix DNA-binding protein [Brevibacillus laterosporus]RAP28612.1 hypothetical protein C2W64_04668 [Brevibacillus laterosporus]